MRNRSIPIVFLLLVLRLAAETVYADSLDSLGRQALAEPVAAMTGPSKVREMALYLKAVREGQTSLIEAPRHNAFAVLYMQTVMDLKTQRSIGLAAHYENDEKESLDIERTMRDLIERDSIPSAYMRALKANIQAAFLGDADALAKSLRFEAYSFGPDHLVRGPNGRIFMHLHIGEYNGLLFELIDDGIDFTVGDIYADGLGRGLRAYLPGKRLIPQATINKLREAVGDIVNIEKLALRQGIASLQAAPDSPGYVHDWIAVSISPGTEGLLLTLQPRFWKSIANHDLRVFRDPDTGLVAFRINDLDYIPHADDLIEAFRGLDTTGFSKQPLLFRNTPNTLSEHTQRIADDAALRLKQHSHMVGPRPTEGILEAA